MLYRSPVTSHPDPQRSRTVLITGAAGGLGRAAVEMLAGAGWAVWAADLPGPALDALDEVPGVRPLELDVTDQASVDAAAQQVRASGTLDAVVNFAGVLTLGSLAELPVEEVQRVLDVNLLGTYRVNRALIPMVIDRQGRIVNISSETGHQSGAPFNGVYAMSKHAIEAYSDSLRRELALVGVRVVKVQPGPFRTSMTASIRDRVERAAQQSERFASVIRGVGEMAAKEEDKASDPSLLAETIREALETARPKAAYSVKPAWSRQVFDLLPTRVGDALLKVLLRRYMR